MAKAKRAPKKMAAYPAYPSGGNQSIVGPVAAPPKKAPKKAKR